MLSNWNVFIKRLVEPLPAASRPPQFLFSLLKRLYPLRVALTHFVVSSYD